MKAKVPTWIACVCCAVVLIGGGCMLAYSSTLPHTYDGENFTYADTDGTTRTVKLPACSAAEVSDASTIPYEERALTYDGSWRGNGVQTDQYTDGRGGTYMFDGKTDRLSSISVVYSDQAERLAVTEKQLLALSDGYLQLHLPHYETYALSRRTADTDNGYDFYFGIPVTDDWIFSAFATVSFDPQGRLTMLTLPTTDIYAQMSDKECAAIASALPSDDELNTMLNTYLTERCGKAPFRIREAPLKYVKKEDNGYCLSVMVVIDRGQGDMQYVEQVHFEQPLEISLH